MVRGIRWAAQEQYLPSIVGDPAASGRNTVNLDGPAKGLAALQGSDSVIFAVIMQLDAEVVSYSGPLASSRA